MPGWPPSTRHQRIRVVGELDLDLAVVELAVAQHRRAASRASRRCSRRRRLARAIGERAAAAARQQQIEQALLGGFLRARPDLRGLLVAHELDRDLDEIAHDRVDVAADVADLGELATPRP